MIISLSVHRSIRPMFSKIVKICEKDELPPRPLPNSIRPFFIYLFFIENGSKSVSLEQITLHRSSTVVKYQKLCPTRLGLKRRLHYRPIHETIFASWKKDDDQNYWATIRRIGQTDRFRHVRGSVRP